jgi:hypothetical protein
MMKSFRNVFLVTAVAATSLLGWGCREGERGRQGTEDQAGQQGQQDLQDQQGTGGAGDTVQPGGSVGEGESQELDQRPPGEGVGGSMEENSGDPSGAEPDTRR